MFKCNKKLRWIYSSFCIFLKAFVLIGSVQLWVTGLFSFNNERKQILVCSEPGRKKPGVLKYVNACKPLNNHGKENNAAL